MERQLLKDHILQLEKRLMSYEYSELDELLAEDFLEFGSSGTAYDKKQQLEAANRTAGENNIKFTVTNFSIKWLDSNVLLATYRTYKDIDGKHALRSSIWKNQDDKWQMIFHQGTPIKFR